MLYKLYKELNRRKNKTFATVKIMHSKLSRFQKCIVKFTYPTYASLRLAPPNMDASPYLYVHIMNYLEIDIIRSLVVEIQFISYITIC